MKREHRGAIERGGGGGGGVGNVIESVSIW